MAGVTINGKTHDFDDLQLGEVEQIEDAMGQAFHLLSPTKQAIGAVWVIVKRDEPDFTLDDARKVSIANLTTEDASDPSS